MKQNVTMVLLDKAAIEQSCAAQSECSSLELLSTFRSLARHFYKKLRMWGSTLDVVRLV